MQALVINQATLRDDMVQLRTRLSLMTSSAGAQPGEACSHKLGPAWITNQRSGMTRPRYREYESWSNQPSTLRMAMSATEPRWSILQHCIYWNGWRAPLSRQIHIACSFPMTLIKYVYNAMTARVSCVTAGSLATMCISACLTNFFTISHDKPKTPGYNSHNCDPSTLRHLIRCRSNLLANALETTRNFQSQS